MTRFEKILIPLTAVCMMGSLYLVFIWAPAEKSMGEVQRIFYFHVPAAWISFLAFTVVFIASLLYLAKRRMIWDYLAASSAEVGLLFCTMVLITGPIWAKPAWGVWWTWDLRLTLTLVLWLIYAGYMLLRAHTADIARRARFAAVLGIIGFLDIPLVYLSIRWWRTQHPQPVFGNSADAGLEPEMLITLLACAVSFILLYLVLCGFRYRIYLADESVHRLREQLRSRDKA